MWTPKQLLKEETIKTLYLGGFSTLQIEFLGWLSYNAAALNHSRNPVKAAHTILAKESTVKMLEVFAKKKKETIKPEHTESHPEANKIFDDLDWYIRKETTKAQMTAGDYEDHTKEGVHDGDWHEDADPAYALPGEPEFKSEPVVPMDADGAAGGE
jgi:hypothetical protein